MRRVMTTAVSLALLVGGWPAGRAEAFTSKQKATAITVGASGVTPTQTLSVQVVDQGVMPDTSSPLDFGTGANDMRDSEESLKVTVSTNLAANRILIYTDNLNGSANPKYCEDTAKGNDGGGLVGVTDCKTTVPLEWYLGVTNISATPKPDDAKVFTATSVNTDFDFGSGSPTGPGSGKGVFITDLAHVATFTTKNNALDNQNMKRCDGAALPANLQALATQDNDGLYVQFFGGNGVVNSDMCDAVTNAKVDAAEELSKNIAVVAFGCLGTKCLLPRLDTTSTTDDLLEMSGPFYLPIAADFRTAPGQNYGTNTLTLELVTQ